MSKAVVIAPMASQILCEDHFAKVVRLVWKNIFFRNFCDLCVDTRGLYENVEIHIVSCRRANDIFCNVRKFSCPKRRIDRRFSTLERLFKTR